MYKLIFFVPTAFLEPVKAAVFATGAGRQGEYENCCWQALGVGQFRPLRGSRPYVGEVSQDNFVPEYRVEMLCPEVLATEVINALRSAHPYEEPAYELLDIIEI
ncbi:MAG: NGG1p interacting factor NIF3 [Spongiibacteraceae bacterium]